MTLNWKNIAGILVGAGMALAMIFANSLGLDNNSQWGAKRYILFLLGVFIFLFAALYRKENFIGRFTQTQKGQAYAGAILLNAVIIAYYIWCVSIGLWTDWRYETNYYDQQASAFRHGQVALKTQPDPKLLAFENFDAYEPSNREGIPVLWDATFYNGKYYLYWGPAPAFLPALLKFFYAQEIGDNALTFAYLSATLIFLTLLILHLWKTHFAPTPRWALWLGIAFAGLVNPMTYILFEPRIYEAAIIAAQFFLMSGTYFLLRGFDRPSAPRFLLAGIFLACAVGSRTTLFPAVGFLAFITLLWALKTQRASAMKFILALGIPLALGAISYPAYNFARFDSIAEFGLRYQLTSYNLYKDLGKTFSLTYVPPNLYKTLFNPFEIRKIFPYIFPTRWNGPAWLAEINPSNFYLLLAESITGIFIASPFMIFAFLAGINKNARWILAALSGSALLTFFTLQVFFFATMRYLLDLIPTLVILAVIGFWQGLNLLKSRPFARFVYSTFGLLLFIYGTIISFTLSISAHFEQIRGINPDLLKQLAWMFNPLFK